jgi:hypothetical protein
MLSVGFFVARLAGDKHRGDKTPLSTRLSPLPTTRALMCPPHHYDEVRVAV